MNEASRCTGWKHIVENGSQFCDCGRVIVTPTAAKNALVVNVLRIGELNFAAPTTEREET